MHIVVLVIHLLAVGRQIQAGASFFWIFLILKRRNFITSLSLEHNSKCFEHLWWNWVFWKRFECRVDRLDEITSIASISDTIEKCEKLCNWSEIRNEGRWSFFLIGSSWEGPWSSGFMMYSESLRKILYICLI